MLKMVAEDHNLAPSILDEWIIVKEYNNQMKALLYCFKI